MSTQIQVRRGTASDWSSEDPVLAEGEIGLETDTGKYKIGDGSAAWSSLEYTKYTDSEAIAAINNDGDHGSTAPHDYVTSPDIDHDSTTGGTDSDAHHSRYTDSEAVGATDGVIDADTVDGLEASELGAAADVESVDGYDLSVVAALPDPTDDDTIYFVEA